ncbi:tRNA uridine-5-carboxymethylaminomethyl(34) synthesis GTPase MnmE [Buchnera aphidicola]|uniref:tRNA modification GTPase MnmE n=1 Tax=Buchnera aphidicola (Sarucallis kahawaluokalani) TaxID=1241878 RepID=A0A4D6Y860_9GAMM|nr:tRNA uridine-5-carboxymethylaminomethyl(34) synthesis GTPase MnmE [Buchnera aphidicola]QCI25827.1 tRNA uridine-5-carboxymethylaminomethyl(34) synthesis GTPase MnmE [Buchnera aphidicola (Sarucallis kahawaluokalani)]
MNDTIIAQSTPYGRSGVGILRISGTRSKEIAYKILGVLPPARYAYHATFFDYKGVAIDEGIAIWFPYPNSFTGEDVLELQGHGNPVILDLLMKSILCFEGVRIARPGEFSQRAFLNGKIDLIQAEAIIKLIHSTSAVSIKSALRTLKGDFSKKINYLINKIAHIRVFVEKILNFPEDDYVIHNTQIDLNLKSIFKKINDIYEKIKIQNVIHDGIKIVISGEPNVGKSTIFNLLSCKNSAIVTNIAGTTRDVLYEHIKIKDCIIQLIDTAGLRKTNNIIEKLGINKAWKKILSSDHIFLVLDNTRSILNQKTIILNFLRKLTHKKKVTILINKCDISNIQPFIRKYYNGRTYIFISAKFRLGIHLLKNHLKKIISGLMSSDAETEFLARQRHLEVFNVIIKHVKNMKKNWFILKNIELLAEDLKIVQDLLNKITGSITSDDIMQEIFKEFCIGK